jgi:hypothetical protein
MNVLISLLVDESNLTVKSGATPTDDDRSEDRLVAANAAVSRGRSRLHRNPVTCPAAPVLAAQVAAKQWLTNTAERTPG